MSHHSKDLIEAIKAVRVEHPDADTFLTEEKMIEVRSPSENTVLGRAATQWEAWMEARRGTSRTPGTDRQD